jgi:putative addiction module component (TIGR02574 family)
MNQKSFSLLREALGLSLQDRAEFAAELLASIDGEPDTDVEAAWAKEIERRAERALSGVSQGTEWETVRARIEQDLLRDG